MNGVKRFFQQAWLYYKGQYTQFSFQEVFIYRMALPLFTLIYYCMAAQYGFNSPRLTHWVIGNSFLLCTSQGVFRLGLSFGDERFNGRLRTLVVSPHNKLAIVMEKSFVFIFEGLLTSSFGILCGSLIFGISFADVNLLTFAIVLISGMVAAMGFGMFLSAFGLVSDSMHFILNVIYMAMTILCGANFPVSDLPAAARAISHMLPLTRSIQAADMLFGTVDGVRLTSLLAQEWGVGIAYLLLGFITVKVCERIAIKRATLEMF
mgnify:CR=1 FL=1